MGDAICQVADKRRRCVWGRGSPFLQRTSANVAIQNQSHATKYVTDLFVQRGLRVSVHGRGAEKDFYRLEGTCCEALSCPVRYLIRVYFGDVSEVEIETFHEPHQHDSQEMGFASVFTAAEQMIADRYRATAT